MTEPATPQPRPCASCPYRCNVPSGIWHPDEYAKLPLYDGDMAEQPTAAFMCHQRDGSICSGWLGHRDPSDLLAVRIGVITGKLDPSCMSYTTRVPLFDSGRAAADHGTTDVEAPGPDAVTTITKLIRSGKVTP